MRSFNAGDLVYWQGEAAVILEVKGLNELLVRILKTKSAEIVRATDLSLSPKSDNEESYKSRHLVTSDKDWQKAMDRFHVIEPLLAQGKRTRQHVKEVAEKHSMSTATVYRWLKAFEDDETISSLIRKTRVDRGEGKLSAEVEEVIDNVIQNHFLSKERKSAAKTFRLVKFECQKLGLPIPHLNTVHNRIAQINEQEVVKKRLGTKQYRQKFDATPGSFPGAERPYAVVQIDHTPVDVIVVDQEHRKPIGRPYLTIAIDVATKMISGFVMTLEAPSSLSAGLCVANAILPKDDWLARQGIGAEWPMHGKMQKIHVDNAMEFRGKMLRRACQQHGITLEFRPKGRPNYGPHVERAFRTFMQEAHDIPGTTFSNIQQKLDYDSEGFAIMTLHELDLWFSFYVLYCYHHAPHSGNDGIAPITAYSKALLGEGGQPGIGLPVAVPNEETLRLDFTPYVERTIQRQGIEIDRIQYYSDVLRKWIGAKDPNDPTKKRKFLFARDPRSLSPVYFFDPDTESYVPVPFLNTSRPNVSIWEMREAKKLLKVENSEINEEMIFIGIQKMQELEAEAVEKTKLAKRSQANEKRKRRMAERRKHWKTEVKAASEPVHHHADQMDDDDDGEILPFTDVEFD